MSVPDCCLQGFKWDGEATGRIGKLDEHDVYIAGDNQKAAVLVITDLLGWTFPNVRLVADYYAKEANVTVYVPDFFHGEVLSVDAINNGRWGEVDLPGFMSRNSREIREPEMFAFAKTLKERHEKVGAIGFCYGGWAAFRLGAKEHQPPLVDCFSAGHPSLLTKKDIDEIAVPVQILAPEIDPAFTAELKSHAFETIVKLGVPFDYQHFPGVEHAFLIRGDARKPGERGAMERGMASTVQWFKQFLI
jgi:dienelactone hydrolase